MNLQESFEIMSDVLQEVNMISVIARIALSIVIGGILGTERGLRNRPAGFMTYVLVCVGSTLIMLTNQYIATVIPGTDPGFVECVARGGHTSQRYGVDSPEDVREPLVLCGQVD